MRYKYEVEVNISDIDTGDYTEPRWSSGELYATCTLSLYIEPQACENKVTIDSHTMFFVDQDGGAIGETDDFKFSDALEEKVRNKAIQLAWEQHNG